MKRKESRLTIGVLAKSAGVGVETVRFYERKALIKQPAKSGGFREYSPDTTSRIRFIKRAQELGFTLKEVKELLGVQVTPKSTCGSVKKRADQKISEIIEKIRDLKRMQKTLGDISDCCGQGACNIAAPCSIFECFEGKCH